MSLQNRQTEKLITEAEKLRNRIAELENQKSDLLELLKKKERKSRPGTKNAGKDDCIATILDFSDHANKGKELNDQEKLLKTVMDNLPVGIAVNYVDPAVDFFYMNDSFPRIYRTTREELSSADRFWDAVYEDPVYRDSIKKRVLDDVASGEPGRMKWENIPITRKGKETRYISGYNTPVPERGLMISTVIDVTERKKAEEELRKLKDGLEVVTEEQTRELKEKVSALERFHKATIDREFRIKELRDEIERLKVESGQRE